MKSQVFNSKIKIIDTLEIEKKIKLTPTLVNKNSYQYLENYITLDIGENDGIKEDFGVITSNGIVGIIDQTSSKYARVLSILNCLLYTSDAADEL